MSDDLTQPNDLLFQEIRQLIRHSKTTRRHCHQCRNDPVILASW